MLISEIDLYKREWLSLVFKNRNQQYGAYELRHHYANVLSRSMAVTFFVVAALGITTTLISRYQPVPKAETFKLVHIDNSIHVMPQRPPAEKPKAEPAKAAPKAIPVTTQKYIAMKPVPDEQVKEDVKPIDPNVAVGQTEVKAPASATINVPVIDDPTGVPEGTGNGKDDVGVYDAGGLQVMPEPVGGANAWAKFLQKNLRYPPAAVEQGLQGRVFLSFIIEKDGHLSDITIVRKAGYGFDEESMRVLKLAPAWKPGIQNGHQVRVRYTLPINFQMTD